MAPTEEGSALGALTARQKQVAGGGFLLAVGIAAGIAIAPGATNDTSTPSIETVTAAPDLDVAEYHRAASAARAGRSVVDVLTALVSPGEFVTAEVNMPLGTRPTAVDLVGLAEARFAIDCTGCGLSFEDRATATTIRLRAQNASQEPARLTALIHYTSAGE